MIAIEELNHVAVICSDIETSTAFYCGVLGFEVQNRTYRQQRDSWLICLSLHGTYLLELFTFPQSPARLSYPEACGLRHLAFRVRNLEATLHQLDAMGVPHEPMRHISGGEKCAFLHDPDGLPIELVETGTTSI